MKSAEKIQWKLTRFEYHVDIMSIFLIQEFLLFNLNFIILQCRVHKINPIKLFVISRHMHTRPAG